jgi:hypothetical protein
MRKVTHSCHRPPTVKNLHPRFSREETDRLIGRVNAGGDARVTANRALAQRRDTARAYGGQSDAAPGANGGALTDGGTRTRPSPQRERGPFFFE